MTSRVLESELLQNPDCVFLDEPILMFHPAHQNQTQDPLEGLRKQGPFDSNSGRNFNKLEIYAISSPTDSTDMKNLTNALVNGCGIYRGFASEFSLSDVQITHIDCKSSRTITEPELNQLIKPIAEDGRFDSKSERRTIVLWSGPDHKSLTDLGHRILTKRVSLGVGLPTQYVSSYQPDSLNSLSQDQFALYNLALNMYAKIGGVPWILKSPKLGIESVDAVAGFRFVRNYTDEDGRYVVGSVSVFGKYGRLYGFDTNKLFEYDPTTARRWKGYSDSATVSYSDSQVMTNILLNIHKKHRNQNPEHLVIHRLGPYHPDEIRGITKVLDEHEIKRYALLEIIRDNGFRIFDKTIDGFSSICRGLSWAISSDTALISTTGNTQILKQDGPVMKYHKIGTPRLLEVRIRKSVNSFTNIHQASQNVLVLTALHWGSAFTKEILLPVSLEFARKVASLYKGGVEPHDCLRTTPWFL